MSDLLKRIERRPESYIGYRSLKRLNIFLKGYQIGAKTAGKIAHMPYEGFQQWIKERYKLPESEQPWYNIMLLYAQDDAEAFNVFFPLHRQFTNSIPKIDKLKQIETLPNNNGDGDGNSFNLYQLFIEIRANPTAHLHENYLNQFTMLIEGIIQARKDFHSELSIEEIEYENFSAWVFQHYNIVKSTYPWERIYWFFRKKEEVESFFIDYNLYLQENCDKSLTNFS